jgi:RNA polymerase sigma-70 factor, ECF subfamily
VIPDSGSAASVAAVGVRADPAERGIDEASRDWLAELRDDGPRRDAAVARLHGLLLRAARFEVARRRTNLPHLRGEPLEDLATQTADDALVAVLAKLDDYRGASRFTTWAYKFALLEAAVRLRRLGWQRREVPLEPASWELFDARRTSPHAGAEMRELLGALQAAIGEQLTPHQREVLVAITLRGVPIDVLAERLNTTRGALYKTLHDARQKLRRCLADQGMDIEGVAG